MAVDSQSKRRRAFEDAVFEHLRPLHAFAYRLTHDTHQAEDLVQETVLRAYRAFDSFEPGTNAKAWLFRILKNTFINEYRRRKARPPEVDFEDLESAYEHVLDESGALRAANPEEALAGKVVAEDIDDALADMPEDFRMVAILCLVEGFTYQEAADALEIPIGTVMSRLYRGRRFLQARLLQHAAERGLGAPAPATESPTAGASSSEERQ